MLLKSKPGRRRDRSGPPALKKLRPDSLFERLDATLSHQRNVVISGSLRVPTHTSREKIMFSVEPDCHNFRLPAFNENDTVSARAKG